MTLNHNPPYWKRGKPLTTIRGKLNIRNEWLGPKELR